MERYEFNEAMLENFKMLKRLLEICIETSFIFEHEITHLGNLFQSQREAIQYCIENFINPMISGMEGYQNSLSENAARGAGGDATNSLLLFDLPNESYTASIDLSETYNDDKIHEQLLGNGAVVISIPRKYFDLVNENKDLLKDIINDFMSRIKGETREHICDFFSRSAIVEIANLLKIDFSEAKTIFKFFVWQYVQSM